MSERMVMSQSEHLWQENQRLERQLRERDEEIARLRDREADIAGMLQVADGGRYRADWEAPIRRLAEWRKALQSLTPGGSEFQSPETCEAYVREKLRQGHEKAKEVVRLGREIARLRKAFRHTHVAGPDGDLDTCRECALNIRNPIHRREER